MLIAHLLASPFFGGPERQVLGLSKCLPASSRSLFLSFSERGLARDFLGRAAALGFEAVELRHNWPNVAASVREIAAHLRRSQADIVCTSGYKPDFLGWLAARRVGLPIIAIAHGWTSATLRTRLNESLDRWLVRHMDCVVCVSRAEARRVAAAGVRPQQLTVIENAVDTNAVATRNLADRQALEQFFERRPQVVVAAAGRLSAEKGFDVFVDAVAQLTDETPDAGFILFGDGPLRPQLERRIADRNLAGRFVLGGFRDDLSRLLPQADLLVLSSYTEGMPVILLEALAAGLPVVATAVGGVPEVIDDGRSGYLVPPGRAADLATAVKRLIVDASLRRQFGAAGRQRVAERHSLQVQSEKYQQLFDRLCGRRRKAG
jgi:glycosyltransferase involved in cell wall biosynthesis